MKNVPLALKIWLVLTAITLCLFTMLAFLLPWTLKGFFTEQIYEILLDSQRTMPTDSAVTLIPAIPANPARSSETVNRLKFVTSISKGTLREGLPIEGNAAEKAEPYIEQHEGPEADAEGVKREASDSNQETYINPEQQSLPKAELKAGGQMKVIRADGQPFSIALKPLEGPGVQHLIMLEGGTVSKTEPTVPVPFVEAIELDAEQQQDPVQTYSRSIDDRTMFYVIRKELLEGKPGFMVSYAWGNYRNDLVMTMFVRLMLLMTALIVISWIPCLWLARYLSRPLVLMERQVGRIAERDWHEPFVLDRKDEMGRLAQAFEAMRQRLVRQDKAQQFFLQNISHELKTPVMVIHSYAQSILDGIYPKGSIAGSVETIKSEAVRLEKRIRDLLYLNKLNYLSARERKLLTFDLSAVIGDCMERLRFRRPELEWTVDLPVMEIKGDPEQWGIAVENILDNQLRYAEKRITITVTDEITNETEDRTDASVRTKAAIRIWNDGPPIDEALRESLFDQFRTGPNGQFGLGLAIVKQIVEAHQSQILISKESQGAGFIIVP